MTERRNRTAPNPADEPARSASAQASNIIDGLLAARAVIAGAYDTDALVMASALAGLSWITERLEADARELWEGLALGRTRADGPGAGGVPQ